MGPTAIFCFAIVYFVVGFVLNRVIENLADKTKVKPWIPSDDFERGLQITLWPVFYVLSPMFDGLLEALVAVLQALGRLAGKV
jgi:hypothetical protein